MKEGVSSLLSSVKKLKCDGMCVVRLHVTPSNGSDAFYLCSPSDSSCAALIFDMLSLPGIGPSSSTIEFCFFAIEMARSAKGMADFFFLESLRRTVAVLYSSSGTRLLRSSSRLLSRENSLLLFGVKFLFLSSVCDAKFACLTECFRDDNVFSVTLLTSTLMSFYYLSILCCKVCFSSDISSTIFDKSVFSSVRI